MDEYIDEIMLHLKLMPEYTSEYHTIVKALWWRQMTVGDEDYFFNKHNHLDSAIEMMLDLGYVECIGVRQTDAYGPNVDPKAFLSYRITPQGIILVASGGFGKKQREEQELKQSQIEANRATKQTSDLVRRTTLIQIILLVVTIGISGMAWYTASRQTDLLEQELQLHKKEFEREEQRIQTIDSSYSQTNSQIPKSTDSKLVKSKIPKNP
jgi:hypothetical protein